MIEHFKGPLYSTMKKQRLDLNEFRTFNGVEKVLEWVKNNIDRSGLDDLREVFEKYIYKVKRNKGETFREYAATEETAYRDLQDFMNQALQDGTDQYSGDEGDRPTFKLPRKLRGWYFLENMGLPKEQHALLYSQTEGTTDIVALKREIPKIFS